ncbi:TetR/AcrR family transcriptional regulator [Nonomuraea deserti]|uniref:TetR/AcrR family transcriptional regulator n=1 Tax=Nonomuraea deserti TaxID=1848322 RepID=A0A4R4UJ17_9ACTN|nr:TetR/AcrR family transcriptional regulator [Nonomuraea deserti]TDC88762.1 TetR/AcrR family transcriptional regulator [Nonomuraea deserti]
MTPKRVDKTERRQQILAAAVRVFARKGFAATRIDDVAAEAGIAKGSVYLYFDSRDALLKAAFEAHAARVAALLTAADDGGDPLDRLETLIGSTLTMLVADADLARVQLDVWNTPLDMAGLYRDYRTAVAGLLRQATIRPGTDPDRAAAVIVGAVEGCLLQCLADPELDLGDLAGPIIRICVRSLR